MLLRGLRGSPFGLLVLILASRLCFGADAFDETWRWVRYDTDYGLPSNSVNDVVETPAGGVWASTSAGLAWYDGYRWHAMGPGQGVPAARSSSVRAFGKAGILAVVGGHLYKGGENGFHLVPLKAGGTVLRVAAVAVAGSDHLLMRAFDTLYEHSGGVTRPFVTKSDAPMHEIVGLHQTRTGTILLNTRKGFYRWSNGDWALLMPYPGSNILFNTVAENRDGVALAAAFAPREAVGVWEWRGSERPKLSFAGEGMFQGVDIDANGGAMAVDLTGQIFVRRNSAWSVVSLSMSPLERASFVKFRDSGDLWVGTTNGLYLYRSSSSRWTLWKSAPTGSRNMVNEIIHARDGSIWTATGNGIGVLRQGAMQWTWPVPLKRPLVVTGLAEDEEGGIWASSGADFTGAYRFDGRQWRHVGPSEGLPDLRFHRIQKDRRGRLWFLGFPEQNTRDANASARSGVYVYSKGRFEPWGDGETMPGTRFYCFAEADDGAYWFGGNGGLFRWKAGKWKRWRTAAEVRGWVFTLAIDRLNRVWFGDRSGGLGLVENDEVRFLTTTDGLISDAVWDLKIDPSGRLWIATYGGLGCYYKGIWSRFTHGLANHNLWPILALKDRVYVGTAAGLHSLSLAESFLPGPKVSITPASIAGNAVAIRWQAFPYWGEVPAQDVETRFRLDDEGWSPWSARREISYLQLPPGPHEFRVQAKSLFGNLSDESGGIQFEIPYPLYRQPSFFVPVGILLVALASLGSAYVGRRRRHEAQLRRGAEQHRAILQTAQDGFFMIDLRGAFLDVNDAYCRMLGYTREEMLGMSVADVEAIETADDVIRRIERMRRSGSDHFESRQRTKSGRVIDVEVTAAFLASEQKVFSFLRDITQRKLAEQTLRKSEERYRQFIETAQEGIWVVDKDGTITYVNDKLVSLLGYSRNEILHRPVDDFIEEDLRIEARRNRERRRQGYKEQYSFTFRRKDGSPLHTIVSANPLFDERGEFRGSLGMLTDITERTLAEQERIRLEEQLRQAQKMESIGRLAGGVAHDFNNILTVINGYSEILLKELPPDARARTHAELVRAAGERAANLTQQLLAFSRKQIIQPRPLDLNAVVADTGRMLRRIVGEDIQLESRLTSADCRILADPNQIHQILMNLVVNARDAMPKGGRVLIETDATQVSAEAAAEHPDATPGAFAVLSVSDTGIGMDAQTLRKIFEPFFTTKEQGKGTGLGLSTVYGIVRQNEGWVSVDSQLGAGSTFRIYLPLIGESEAPRLEMDQNGLAGRGSETILVVEDQEDLRQLTVAILETQGYTVLAAADGQEALEVALNYEGPIHAMVTDIVMPGITGRELAERMKVARPDTRILFMTGYTEDVIAPSGVLAEEIALIEKPFTPDELTAKLRTVLE